jgi:hypothetical protein
MIAGLKDDEGFDLGDFSGPLFFSQWTGPPNDQAEQLQGPRF